MQHISLCPPGLWAMLFLVVLLGPPSAARAADDATNREVARTAALEALGRLTQALGEDVVAAKISSLNYIISTFDNVNKPCNCTLKLMRAILRDYLDMKGGGGVVYGLNFRQAIIDCFKPPSDLFTGPILNAQGEALAESLLGPGRFEAFLKVLRYIELECAPPSSTTVVKPSGPGTSGGTPTPKPPPGTGGETATGGEHSTPPTVVPVVCPNCIHLQVRLARESGALSQAESRRQDLQGQLASNESEQAKAQRRISSLEGRLQDQKGIGASGYDPATGITVRSYDQGNGQVKTVTQFPDGTQSVRYRPRASTAALQKALEQAKSTLQDLQSEAAALRKSLNQVNQDIDRRRWIIRDLERLLAACRLQQCVSSVFQGGLLPGFKVGDGYAAAGHFKVADAGGRNVSSCLNRIDGRLVDSAGKPMAHVVVGIASQRALTMTDGGGNFLLETDRCGDGGNLELLGIDATGDLLELPLVAGSNLSLGAVSLGDRPVRVADGIKGVRLD